MPAVLSNGPRILALYPAAFVGWIPQAIVKAGAIFLMGFVDAAPEHRRSFEKILHPQGNDPAAWGQATLRVEKGVPGGPFKTGTEVRLRDVRPIADVLGKAF
ncbi:MAG: hypothetical protein WCB18_00950 [Thermoplasmata archaeon]